MGELSSSFEYGLNAAAKSYDGKNKYIRITDIDDETRTFLDSDLTSPDCDLALSENYLLQDGDIVFARTGASVGKTFIYKASDGVVYYAGFLIRARLKENVSPQFVFYNTLTKKYEKFIRITSQRSGQPGVNAQEYATFELFLPKYEEQCEIGKFFCNLDHLITLHQCKCRRWYKTRKFVWEQRKLGETYQKIRNAFVGTASPYYVDSGHFYLESNNVKDGQINRNTEIFINDEFYEKQKDNWLHTGDIVMVQSGHVGHTAVIPENLDNTAAHALIIIANPVDNTVSQYINYYFQTKRAKAGIDNITTGNTIKHILASEMKKFEIMLPQDKEQQMIADHFQNIDNLITLHQWKLEKLKNIKKLCLREYLFRRQEK